MKEAVCNSKYILIHARIKKDQTNALAISEKKFAMAGFFTFFSNSATGKTVDNIRLCHSI